MGVVNKLHTNSMILEVNTNILSHSTTLWFENREGVYVFDRLYLSYKIVVMHIERNMRRP